VALRPIYGRTMRDREIVDAELRMLAAVRRALTANGDPAPGIGVIDGLLDERARYANRVSES
jgi:hypothetical protein